MSFASCCFFPPSHPATMDNYSFDSIVIGYHVYKDIWGAQQGMTLPCQRETSNGHDPFVIGEVKNDIIVGQVPRRFSVVFSCFFKVCSITGSRIYSRDLHQGGLEITCIFTFSREPLKLQKAKSCTDDLKNNIMVLTFRFFFL